MWPGTTTSQKIKNNYNTKNIWQYYWDVHSILDNTLNTEPDDIVNTWLQYFEELLNIQNGDNPSTKSFHTCDLPTEEPTYKEVKKDIAKLKNTKNHVTDNIPPEFLKRGKEKLHQEILHHEIYNLIVNIWKEKETHDEWKENIITPVHKMRNKLRGTNYWSIYLIDNTKLSKILSLGTINTDLGKIDQL